MSAYQSSLLSQVYAFDMPSSSSTSDESENDAGSPQPHTPQEDGTLMAELHTALGEELLEQLEMQELDDKDIENFTIDTTDVTNRSASENSSRHGDQPSAKGVSSGAPRTDKQTGDVMASQKQSRLLCNASSNSTAINVDSTQELSATRGSPSLSRITTDDDNIIISDTPQMDNIGALNTAKQTDSQAPQDAEIMTPNIASFSVDESRESSPGVAEEVMPDSSVPTDDMERTSDNEKSEIDLPKVEDRGAGSVKELSREKAVTAGKAPLIDSLANDSNESPSEEKKSETHDIVSSSGNEPSEDQKPGESEHDTSEPLTPPRRLPIFESIAVEPTLSQDELIQEASNEPDGLFLSLSEESDSSRKRLSDGHLNELRNTPDASQRSSAVVDAEEESTASKLIIPEAVKQPRLGTPEHEMFGRGISFERPSSAISDDISSPFSEKGVLSARNAQTLEEMRTNEIPTGSPLGNEPWSVPIGTPSQHRNLVPMSIQTTPPASYMVVANAPQVQRFVPEMQKAQPVPFGAYAVQPLPKDVLQPASTGGRRKIRLKLEEDVPMTENNRRSWFSRKSLSSPKLGFSKRNMIDAVDSMESHVDRGSISVSWYEGTTSAELQEHVRKSIVRKLGLQANTQLLGLRVIDETMDPPEEIVLSSYIPDGSEFLLRFATKEPERAKPSTFPRHLLRHSHSMDPPISPSAALSPYQSSVDLQGLSADELKALEARLDGMPLSGETRDGTTQRRSKREVAASKLPGSVAVNSEDKLPDSPLAVKASREQGKNKDGDDTEEYSRASGYSNGEEYPKDPIEARLRQITELLLLDRETAHRERRGRREEKKQVIFVLANYFVLFLSLIAISAEIQARAPSWMEYLENQMASVQKCATDRDSLFECVSNGDFSGLIASFVLWITRSAATKRIFLFGFESPKRLWTVVYEALVTAFCWGTSYTFIRRGMNPDTRRNFLQKYWKDAVYGSLAGFNASFMKAVLKNLIPQEAFENALDDRELRLKIFSFLPSFH